MSKDIIDYSHTSTLSTVTALKGHEEVVVNVRKVVDLTLASNEEFLSKNEEEHQEYRIKYSADYPWKPTIICTQDFTVNDEDTNKARQEYVKKIIWCEIDPKLLEIKKLHFFWLFNWKETEQLF